MDISLIVTYKKRREHLEQLIAYFSRINFNINIEIVLIEGDVTDSLSHDVTLLPYMRYHHMPMEGVFHKVKLLNIGLQMARGKYVIPYDVDLLPLNGALDTTFRLAKNSPGVLVSGYRLMSPTPHYDENPEVWGYAPEDSQSAIRKQILNGERFGVCPAFLRTRLLDIGGWNEKFQGWGGEDQEIIERYCATGVELARFPGIAYVHLDHDVAEGWNDEQLTQRNRDLYHSLQQKRTVLNRT